MAQGQNIQISVGVEEASLSRFEQRVGGVVRDIESKQINFRVNSQPLGQIDASLTQVSKSLDAANARVIAFGASVSIISTLSLAFKSLVSDTIAVEKSLAAIGAITGASNSQLKDLSNSIFDIGRNTATSFQEASQAVADFARQGLGLEESLKRTNEALILSRISGLDLSKAIQTLTASVNAFQSSGLSTGDVVNKLGAITTHFAASVKDVSDGLSRSAAAASGAKVNFDQLAALITSLQQTTQRGGGIIGNAIKSIFTRIERPQVLDDLQQLGIATKDVSGASLSAIDVLTNLARSYDKLGESQKSAVAEQVGGLFQINLLKSALKDLGGGYSVYSAALQTSLGATNEAIARNQELNKTLAALAVQTGQSAVQAGAKVGDKALAPAISGVLGTANNALQGISDTLDGKGIGGKIGGEIANGILDVIGQTISGPGLLVVGALVTKLTVGLAGSLRQAFNSLAGQNTAAAEQSALQKEIQGVLATNPNLYARIASGASSVVTVERELLELTEARTAALRAQQAVAASISAELYTGGVRAIPINQGGGLTTRGAGLLPEESQAERAAAYGAGYEPGEIKSMNIKSLGRVVYNTAETIKNFSGFDQPAILPPRGSRGGSNYEKAFKDKYGFDPYGTPSEETSSGGRRFGGGYVPNYAVELDNLNYLGAKESYFGKGGLHHQFLAANTIDKTFAALPPIAQLLGRKPNFRFAELAPHGYHGAYHPKTDITEIDNAYAHLSKDKPISNDLSDLDDLLYHELGHNVHFNSLKQSGYNGLYGAIRDAGAKDANKFGINIGSSTRRVDAYSKDQIPHEVFADVFSNAARGNIAIPNAQFPDVPIHQLQTYLLGKQSGLIPFGSGLVPNFANDDFLHENLDVPGFDDMLARAGRGESTLSLAKRKLEVGYINSEKGSNPLFGITQKLKNNELSHIDAGAIVGPRIPAMIASLIEQRKAGRLGDAQNNPVQFRGLMFPNNLLSQAQRINREGAELNSANTSISDRQLERLKSSLTKLGADDRYFAGGEKEHDFLRVNMTVGAGYVPNYAVDFESSTEGGGMFIKAMREGNRIGSLSSTLYPDQARIESIQTHKNFRGKGIATGLYQKLAQEAIGGNRRTISGALTPQDDENGSVLGTFPQLTRARLGKHSNLHFDQEDIQKSFRIRPDSFDQDILKIQKAFAGKSFGGSLPELETHFGAGMVPNFSIGDAMNRERASLAALGYSPQQVNNSIRFAPSSDLPHGGVYNTLQEKSITDGVNAAVSNGQNPLTKGVTPNFADDNDNLVEKIVRAVSNQSYKFSPIADEAQKKPPVIGPDLKAFIATLSGSKKEQFFEDNSELRPPSNPKQSLETASRLGNPDFYGNSGYQVSVAKQSQISGYTGPEGSSLSIVPPTAKRDLSEIGQAMATFSTTIKDAKGNIVGLTEQEQNAIRARISEIDATKLSAEALQSRISLIKSDVESSNASRAALSNARNIAINGLPARNPADAQVQRELQVSDKLSNILSSVGDKFQNNPVGLNNFENQQAERLNRQALLKEQQSSSFSKNTGQVSFISDLITKARIGTGNFVEQNPLVSGANNLARGIGSRLERAQLPIILGSEAVTAGVRQTFGANSGITAGAEALSSSASTAALIASFSPVAGGFAAIGLASYKLLDAFSSASIKLRDLEGQIETQKESAQKTQESASNFLSGRGALQDALQRGANPSEIARLSTKDQENFGKLTPSIQTSIAGVTDPREIQQRIQEELEKVSKGLASLSSEKELLSDRKTVLSSFGGLDENGQAKSSERTGFGAGLLGTLLPPLAALQSARDANILGPLDEIARGNNKLGNFDGSKQGDQRLENTVSLLQARIPKETLNSSLQAGTLGNTLSTAYNFKTDDVNALIAAFQKLAETQKQNEVITKLQNDRLIENSQIQNRVNQSVDLYNKTLLQNAASLSILSERSINRQRAGDSILGGNAESQQRIQSFAAKAQIDVLSDQFGVSESGRSRLNLQNETINSNNQRALGINQLVTGASTNTQQEIQSFITSLATEAQSGPLKAKLQANDAESASDINDTQLNKTTDTSKEAIAAINSILPSLQKSIQAGKPEDVLTGIQDAINQLKTQSDKSTSTDVQNKLGGFINILEKQKDTIAEGNSNLLNINNQQLAELKITNEKTQRLIEIGNNRSAAGGIEGFTDPAKRIEGFANALPGFAAAFQRIGTSGPGVAGSSLQIGSNPNDIGALIPLLQASASFAGGKGEITKELADGFAQANASSVRRASTNLLGQLGSAVGGANFDPTSLNRLDLSKFQGEFDRLDTEKTRVSNQILSGSTTNDEKDRLQAQSDALARQQQDLITRATKEQTSPLINAFTSDPTQQRAVEGIERNITSANLRANQIGRDQVNGAFNVIGADKQIDPTKLNTTLDTGQRTVAILQDITSKVLTNNDAKTYLEKVERVSLVGNQLEERIRQDVALIRLQGEKNQLQGQQISLESSKIGAQGNLTEQTSTSETFTKLKDLAQGRGILPENSSFGSSVIGKAVGGLDNDKDILAALKSVSEEIATGSTARGRFGREELSVEGFDPSGKNSTQVLQQTLQFASKGVGADSDKNEGNRLTKIAADVVQLDSFNKRLEEVNGKLAPLTASFDALKKKADALSGTSVESARKSILQSIDGGSPQETDRKQGAASDLFAKIDEAQKRALDLSALAKEKPTDLALGTKASDANREVIKLRSDLTGQLQKLGSHIDPTTVTLASEGAPANAIPRTIPSTNAAPGGVPSFIGSPDANGRFTNPNEFAQFRTPSSSINPRAQQGSSFLAPVDQLGNYGTTIPSYKEGPVKPTETPQTRSLEVSAEAMRSSAAALNSLLEKQGTPVTPAGIQAAAAGTPPQASIQVPITVTINQNGTIDKEAIIAQVTASLRDQLKDVPGYNPPPPGGPNGKQGAFDAQNSDQYA